MKAGYPPIGIKLSDRLAYYTTCDEYHTKYNLSSTEKLVARYINERLDAFPFILQNQ